MVDRRKVAKRHGVKRSFRGGYRVEAAYPSGMDDQPIRDASTVCVVRPGADGIEVLMVRRASSSVFVGGAHVFPGGALDVVDRSETARKLFGDGPLSPWLSAAVRETAEEAGLVVPTGEIEAPRKTRGMDLLRALDEAGYVFDPSRFAYLSNWVTPSAALDHWSRGEWMLVQPTFSTLRTLAEFDETEAVLSFAHSQTSIPRIESRVVRRNGTLRILMPGDAGYEEADT